MKISEVIKINKRMVNILEFFLLKDGVANLKDISEHFQLNERTIRYDLDKINDIFLEFGAKPLEKLQKGVFKIYDLECVEQLLRERVNTQNEISSEYKDILILIKISLEERVNIGELCNLFDLSRTTIKSALKRTKEFLAIYNLELNIDYQKGLKLIGKEENLRRLQLKILNQYVSVKDQKNFEKNFCSSEIKKYFQDIYTDINSIQLFINYIIRSLGKVISDEAYTTITNYIIIMIKRIKKNNQLISIENEQFFKQTYEYDIILKGASLIEANFNIILEKFEIIKLTDYFLGSHNYCIDNSFYDNWVEIELMVKKIITLFSQESGVDINLDRELLDGLVNHIKPTIYRINNRIELQNSILHEFLEYYPEIFKMGKNSLTPLKDFLGNEIPDDEIAFISMHFKGALDRNISREKEMKNILIVCGFGYGTSKLLAQEIRKNYNVNILDIIPLNQMEKYRNSELLRKVDIIVTTMDKGNFNTEKPVVVIKNILNDSDIKVLEKYNLPKYNKKFLFSTLLKKIEKGATIFDKSLILEAFHEIMEDEIIDDTKTTSLKLSDCLQKENIVLNADIQNWRDSIRTAGRILEENGSTTSSYTDGMIESIEKNGSYMVTGDMIALSHSRNLGNVNFTGISLLSLKTPIEFPEGRKVQYILAFSSQDSLEHLAPLSLFLDLVKNQNFLDILNQSTSRKKVFDYIKRYEFLINLGKS